MCQNDSKKCVWEGPGRHQKLTSSKKLENSYPTIIYDTPGMSSAPKKHQFRSLKSPKIDEKTSLEKIHQKNDKKCIRVVFFSNFGSQLGPRGGGVLQVTFSRFFELWAVLGPKWLPGLPQEPPGPPQASICTDFCRIFD